MLRHLSVNQVRCFSNLELDLNVPSNGGDGWTMLVGANGVGKSTALQAIVLAGLDPRPVTSLVPDPWTLCRIGLDDADRASVVLTGESNDDVATRWISPREDEYIDADGAVDLPLLIAFAARRRIARPGELPESDNPRLERVRGMFETDHPLLTTDPFAAFAEKSDRREFAKAVRDVVVHRVGDDRMFPLVDLVELRGQGGVTQNAQLLEQRRFQLRYGADYSVRVAVHDLSDGYQAMLALVLEIMAQAALALKRVPVASELEAVILIDEIEAHLHPKWQRTVVPLLRSAFPRCQFVVTTHSPLVVGSAEREEVNVLEIGDDGAVRSDVLEERLSLLGSDEIYEEVFGVPRSAPPNLTRAERERLRQLASPTELLPPEDADYVDEAWRDALRVADDE